MSKQLACIKVSDVSFSYGKNAVLEHISFELKKGDYAGIIGPNGSGKSTLVKILLGLIDPDQGSVELFGQSVKHFSDRHTIGYVPQRMSQMDLKVPVTVEEVVRSGRVTQKGYFSTFNKADAKAVRVAMSVAGIEEHAHHLMTELSGGMRQRVFIARALAGESTLLVLDEPSVGIDIQSQERFYEFLKHLNNTLGITIIIVSHDIDAIAHEVKTLLCLNRTLICHGHPKSVLTKESFKDMYGKDLKAILHGHEHA